MISQRILNDFLSQWVFFLSNKALKEGFFHLGGMHMRIYESEGNYPLERDVV